MVFLTSVVSFFPILLLIHCFFIFLFKRWLGPIGTFYSSLFIFFLSLIASILVLILTALALYFGVEYMYRDAFINRLLYLLNLFATSVIFLFFCYDYFLIILAWECIGLFSLLLVNFYSMRIYTIKAALKTFIFSRISDMFMFLSFVLSIIIFNTTDLSLIFIQTPFFSFHYFFINSLGIHFLTLFSFCLVTSAIIKAAQFFFHVWLPDAMEAPTPASALIHSSTLVIAGVFLIIRFSIIFEFTIFTNYYLAIMGALTLAFGSVTAIFQNDIKKLVAYSTISQIGYLVCGCGFCCYEEVLLYLIIHALNKAFLFILVGYVVHFFNGNTDMRQMGGIYLYSFDLAVLFFGICFNLVGLPYSAGFLGKEFLLFQILRDDFLSFLVRACWVVSFFFTPIYMFILIFLVIFGPKKSYSSVYSLFWNFKFFQFIEILINFFNKNWNFTNLLKIYLNFRFQFVIITCRTTIFILFIFWLFFFFWGEFLILIFFNFSSVIDSVPSNYFFTFKMHNVFTINLISLNLLNTLTFYILFFFFVAIIFLLNLKFSFSYFYLNNFWLFDLFFLTIITYLYFSYFFFFFPLTFFL